MSRLTENVNIKVGGHQYRWSDEDAPCNAALNKLGRLEDAQEILRTKRVDIAHLQDSKDYAEYNEVISKLATLWRVLPLTEEEYKLLRAIL